MVFVTSPTPVDTMRQPFPGCLGVVLLLASCSSVESHESTPRDSSRLGLVGAAHAGDVESITTILDGVDALARPQFEVELQAAFRAATTEGHSAAAKAILEFALATQVDSGLPLTAKQRDLQSALRLAVRSRHADVAGMLLELGAKASEEALVLAVRQGDPESVAKLLGHGAHVSPTALGCAANQVDVTGSAELLTILLSDDAVTPTDACVLAASRAANPDLVATILRKGGNPNARAVGAYSSTSTHRSPGEHVVAASARSVDGRPALAFAIRNRDASTAKILIDAGVDLEQTFFDCGWWPRNPPPGVSEPAATSERPKTFLTLAVGMKDCPLEIVKLLVDHGADPRARDGGGWRPEDRTSDPAVLELLRPQGVRR